MQARRWFAFFAALLVSLSSVPAGAETPTSRFGAGGYMRVMARPDFQGGMGTLGFWNLYGRLLNEGPYAALELRLDLLEPDPLDASPWTSIHAKVEGGSVQNADIRGGSLDNFRLSQLYAEAGNVLLQDVVWRIGTLESFFGDLGLYDMKPAQVLVDTVGLSSRLQKDWGELLLGVGDAGFAINGLEYNSVLSVGGTVKFRLGDHVEVGTGGQYRYEPAVTGNPFAPHDSRFEDGSGLDYENFVRGEVAQEFFQENPGQQQAFPDPVPTSADSWKIIGYIGFGNLGPLIWNNLFANFLVRHPESRTTETFMGQEFDLYITGLTDERHQLNIGNEMQLRLIPGYLDAVWGVLYGYHFDEDNDIKPTENDRIFVSTVLRLQYYLTELTHLLLESSIAQEQSLEGNMFRLHSDSVFQSQDGQANTRGLEFGDSDTRETWQLKVGPVLSPLGIGPFTRPQFRLLYGVQWSNVNNAFSNNFVDSLDEFDDFGVQEEHWHHIVSLEVETWF